MLADILADIAVERGKTSSNEDRNVRIYQVNKAAEEIHSQNDLEEGKDEKVFDFAVDDSPQIALPPFVHQVRGMRLFDGRSAISLEDARNRYNFQWFTENDLWYLKYRKIKDRPLSRNITNASVLKISVPIAEAAEFTVTINGSTDNSYLWSETLTFVVGGPLEFTTIANFTEVQSIVKNIITKYDVIIKDVEGNILGKIQNSEYQSNYKVYQVTDSDGFVANDITYNVEVWYKQKLQPLKNDTDCFLGTSIYDKAIVWKYLEHKSKNPEDAAAFALKCQQAVAAAIISEDTGTTARINLKPSVIMSPALYDHCYEDRR